MGHVVQSEAALFCVLFEYVPPGQAYVVGDDVPSGQ